MAYPNPRYVISATAGLMTALQPGPLSGVSGGFVVAGGVNLFLQATKNNPLFSFNALTASSLSVVLDLINNISKTQASFYQVHLDSCEPKKECKSSLADYYPKIEAIHNFMTNSYAYKVYDKYSITAMNTANVMGVLANLNYAISNYKYVGLSVFSPSAVFTFMAIIQNVLMPTTYESKISKIKSPELIWSKSEYAGYDESEDIVDSSIILDRFLWLKAHYPSKFALNHGEIKNLLEGREEEFAECLSKIAFSPQNNGFYYFNSYPKCVGELAKNSAAVEEVE